MPENHDGKIRVAELFAGVGGFRLGLDGYDSPDAPSMSMPPAGPFETVWANQWEPGNERKQFAARCYKKRFDDGTLVNEDINTVMDRAESGDIEIPDVDMVVGGFPCQSYSVARPSNKSFGLEDQDKGVLWWQICRFIELKHPTYCLFENVDRLLKSPSKQRGRDFAVILSCLNRYGYVVEWHVINAADYGMPQKRRRVYIFARKCTDADASIDMEKYLLHDGVLAHAFPVKPEPPKKAANSKAAVNQNDGVNDDDSTSIADRCMSYRTFDISDDTYAVSESFGICDKVSRFENAGVMIDGHVLTIRCVADYDSKHETLGDVLVDSNDVPESYYVDDDAVERWRWFKSSKSFPRVSADGHEYTYSEGAMAFPDDLSKPARTILTGEGGKSASRMKHIIIDDTGRYRRLVPEELEAIQMFPKGWTDGVDMTDNQRAFCMGNALLTGIPHRIGEAMCEVLDIEKLHNEE